MSIMQQSSKAQDRTLGVWFHHVQQGMVKLPRFQRFEAWDRGRITSFLNTIINNLPVPPPEEKPLDRVREHPPKRRSREREER